MAGFTAQSVVFVCDSVKDSRSGVRTVEFVPAKDSAIQWGSGQAQGVITATGAIDGLEGFVVNGLYEFDISRVG